MNEKAYLKYHKWFRTHRLSLRWFRRINAFLPLLFGASYVFLLFTLVAAVFISNGKTDDIDSLRLMGKLIRITVAPIVVFVSVTIFRKISDSPRPFEVYNIKPLLKTKKKGESFPSRHVASAVIISMVMMSVNVFLGILFMSVSLFLAILRVVLGVHFIKDVFASFVIGVFAGIFLFV